MDNLNVMTSHQIFLELDYLKFHDKASYPYFNEKVWVSVESLRVWLLSDSWKTRDDLLYVLDESSKERGV